MRAEIGFALITFLLFGIVAIPLLSVAGFTGSAVSNLNIRTEANTFALSLLGIILLAGFLLLVFKIRKPNFSTEGHRPTMFYNPKNDLDRITDYIDYARSKRVTKQKIKKNLQDAGWEEDTIGKAFESLQKK